VKYIGADSPLNRKVPRPTLYYLQRIITKPVLRSAAIALLRGWVVFRTGRARGPASSPSPALTVLQTDGIAALGQLLSEQQCRDVLLHLAEKQVTARDRAPFTADARPDGVAYANYALADLVACPHLLALANSTAILDLARRYLRCTPTLSGLSARWSFPAASSEEVVQQFHRDSEDWLAFRIMVYLTPVDEGSGPHVYVKGTHLDRRTVRLPVLGDYQVRVRFGPLIVRQTGAPGFGFAVDTAGLHKGEAPRDAARLLLSFQYSILPCFLYEYEPEYVPVLRHDPYINRLIVRGRPAAGDREAVELDETELSGAA
jgi:hypothetical protein